MKLAIVAATGGIGSQLLEQALAAGHAVTTVVRDARRVSGNVPVFTTDLANPDLGTLRSALQSADAVLSGLGARLAGDTGVAARGTRAIAQAMVATAVRRIVVVSAAPIGTVPSPRRPHPPKYDPGDGFFMRHLLGPVTKAILRRHYADLARMEDALIESAADWTIVRPPRLTNGSLTGAYRVARGAICGMAFRSRVPTSLTSCFAPSKIRRPSDRSSASQTNAGDSPERRLYVSAAGSAARRSGARP